MLRPNALFHDLGALLGQAMAGSIVVVGNGTARLNPISEADAARHTVAALPQVARDLPFGGPEMLTRRAIAEVFFHYFAKPANILPLDAGKIAATSKCCHG